jgi:MoaA/NifB/PqqE/SkfB family radical SAM enzyme
MRLIAGIRYNINLHQYPYEIKLLHRMWKYRQPEIQGFEPSMTIQSLYQTYSRYRTLQTDTISSLPVVILMPHSSCNCRCVMCDIWKGNHNLRQLEEKDIRGILTTLKKFRTQQLVMSGEEALLNPNFFRFCEIIKEQKIKISLLSTGLTIKKNAGQIVKWVDDVIVSLDGDEKTHDQIRNIPGAFNKLREELKPCAQSARISGLPAEQ